MVNLVITGKAVSNTFDNTMEIDTGGAKKVFVIITLVFFCSDFKWSVEKKRKLYRGFTVANHKGSGQSSEPIKTQSKYMSLTQSAGKCVRASHAGFCFYF